MPMKRNLFLRLLSALGSLTLWALGALALAETFFHVPVTSWVGRVLNARTPVTVLVTLLAALVLFGLGLCGMLMLSGKRAAKRNGFVMQKGENGMIGVSVKSIEGLVQTCVNQHDVIAQAEIAVVERRDGIVILLNIQEAAGVNIPLAVGALQKQIKQYVGTCTGVDVHEVRVLVENTDNDAVESPYMVEKPVVLTTAVTAASLHHEAPAAEVVEEIPAAEEAPVLEVPAVEEIAVEEAPVQVEMPAQEEVITAPEAEAAPAEEIPVVEIPVAPAPQVVPVMPALPEIPEEEDDRPLHQRIFGAEEQPVFVPMPPEMVIEPQAEEVTEEPAVEMAEEPVEEIAEEVEASDEIAPNAVLEVVEAIAEEDALAEDEYALEDAADYDEEVLAEEAILDGADEEEVRETEI